MRLPQGAAGSCSFPCQHRYDGVIDVLLRDVFHLRRLCEACHRASATAMLLHKAVGQEVGASLRALVDATTNPLTAYALLLTLWSLYITCSSTAKPSR